MSKGYKKAAIDLETTGCDETKHHIFQIAGRIIDLDGTVIEKFNFKFRPISLLEYDDEALKVVGVTLDELKNLPMSAEQAYNELIELLSCYCNRYDSKDKYQFIAYNAGFDSRFLREFFKHMGDNYYGSWFWNPAICVMQAIAMFVLDVRGSIPNFKLETLCQAAGISWDESKAHDADYDIEQTMQLFDYVRENTRILGE